MVAAQAAGPSRPPTSIEEFLWNIHTVLVQNGGPVQLDNLKDLYSKHLGHKCAIERFLVVGEGGLAATLKRIPHIVSLDTSAMAVTNTLRAGTTKEDLIAADQAYRKELLRKANAAKAKAKAPTAVEVKAKAASASPAPAAEPKAAAPPPQAEKRPVPDAVQGPEPKKPRTEADAETLSKMLVQGVVRVLQNRVKKGLGPLPIGDLEDEFKKLWKVPFNLAQAGETDAASFMQKWPNKVEVLSEGGTMMVQLAKKGASADKAVAAAKKTGEPPAAKTGIPGGSPPPKEPAAAKAPVAAAAAPKVPAPATAAKSAPEEPKAPAAAATAPAAAPKNGPSVPKRPATTQPTRPPATIEDFLWNIHTVIEAYGAPVPLDHLKEAYSKHLGHKCAIERFLVVGEGGLAATLKRIPHVVTICQEGAEVTVKATQPLGTSREGLIQADQAYRRQLQQKNAIATAKTTTPVAKPAATEPKAPAPAAAKTPSPAAPAAAPAPAKPSADGEREAKKSRTEDAETLGKMLVQGVVRVLQNRLKEGKGALPVNDVEEEFKSLWKVPFNLAQANETDTVSFLQKWPNKMEVVTNSEGVQVVQLVKKATEKAKAPTAAKASAGAPPSAQPAVSPPLEAPAQPSATSKTTAGDATSTAPSAGPVAAASTASGASATAGPPAAATVAAPVAPVEAPAAPAPAAPAPAATVATVQADTAAAVDTAGDLRELPEIRKEAYSILQAMQEAARRQEALVAALEKLG